MEKKIQSLKFDERSEKVRNLLGEIPSSFVRWGTAIIAIIFLMLMVFFFFIPYPDSNGKSIIFQILEKS